MRKLRGFLTTSNEDGITQDGGETRPQSAWVSVVAGVFVAFLAWPILSILPLVGLDASWQTGLHLATHAGLQFGKDVVFTYGPYGFLSSPSFIFGWTGVASLLYSGVVVFAFAITVVHLGRRSLTLFGAILLAYLTLLLIFFVPAEVAVVVVFVWCLNWLSRHPEKHVPRSFSIWGGTFAALQLLVRFDTGIVAIAIVGLTVWGAGRRRIRDEVIAAGSFLASFVVFWAAARQPLGGIGRYLHRSLQVASGYSAAMGTESPKRSIEYVAVGIVLFVVLPLILVRGQLARKTRPIVFLLLIAMTYTEILHGFIRHDWAHSTPFLIFAAVLPVAVSWKGLLRVLVIACCAFPLVVAWVLPVAHRSLTRGASDRPSAAFNQIRMAVDPSYRAIQIYEDRLALQKVLKVDQSTLDLLVGHQVAVDPSEISAVYAYNLDWRPFPVFQTYSAYTAALDELNASALASQSGPDRILRQGPLYALDGRYPFFESPAYELAMICHFATLRETRLWEVLGRIHDRCSQPSLIGSVQANAGRLVEIPRPSADQLVYAEIELKGSLSQGILAVVFKPDGAPRVLLRGRSYRLVGATAGLPHVLCIPPSVASPEYGGGVCPPTIAIQEAGPVTIRFYSIRLSVLE